jgi:hypothetical protein
MNERIKELAEQVYGSAATAQEIKFAELIIQKCAMIGNYAYDGGEYPGKMIKEYFGVE